MSESKSNISEEELLNLIKRSRTPNLNKLLKEQFSNHEIPNRGDGNSEKGEQKAKGVERWK